MGDFRPQDTFPSAALRQSIPQSYRTADTSEGGVAFFRYIVGGT